MTAIAPRGRTPELTDRRRAALFVVAALVVAAWAYARVLGGEFQFDDIDGIQRNPAVKDLAGYLRDRFFQGFGRGRPVLDVTFALNYVAGRLEPWNFHLTNVAIHLGVVLLAWAVARLVASLAGAPRSDWIAALTAALFALHPLQSEAVSYVSQRAESLASGFYLATLLLLLEAERRATPLGRAVAVAAALLAFILGIGTKAILVTAPAAWLLVAWIASGSPAAGVPPLPWRTRFAVAALVLAVAAVFAVALLRSLETSGDAGFAVPGVTIGQYLLTQPRALVTYLRLLAWPAGQNVDPDLQVSTTLADPTVLASLAFLLALVAGAVALVKRSRGGAGPGAAAARLAGLGVLWFFLLLSVTSSVVPLADVCAEHRVYLASWGIFLAAAAGGERLASRLPARWRWLPLPAAIAVLAALAVALHQRNAVWETREALWSDAVARSPHKARPYLNLGVERRTRNRYDEAIALFRAGLDRAGRNQEMALKLAVNLGVALHETGRLDEALSVYRRALEIAPDWPDLLINMGVALQGRDPGGAEAFLRRAVAVAPTNPWGWNELGALHLRRVDPRGALPLLERARALDPDFASAHFNVGQALAALGRRAEACAAWKEALALGIQGAPRAEAARLVRGACP